MGVIDFVVRLPDIIISILVCLHSQASRLAASGVNPSEPWTSGAFPEAGGSVSISGWWIHGRNDAYFDAEYKDLLADR
jgi:hypothetical protein